MRKLMAMVERVTGSDVPVLIVGETGAGKETVARAIHEESRRREGPFCVVDCASLPEALLEVELAGALEGAYTDQTVDRKGILLGAAGGTVLLDGLEHLSLAAQAKLLRIIAERRVRPVGAEEDVPVDVRILASTSKDLVLEAREGRFREDLLHRVQVVTLEVPPLRDRTEDLRELVRRLLAENGISSPPAIAPGAWQRLESRPWPGNVRELSNLLARLSVERKSEWTEADVEAAMGEPDTSTFFSRNFLGAERLPVLKDRLERDYLVHHFRRLGGSTPDLCALLGLNRRQLYNRMKRLGISLRVEKSRMDAEGGREDPPRRITHRREPR
jgi:DNA-binding NtrC family response regulator